MCRELGSSLESKRSYLQKRLKTIGFRTLQTQGSYFLVADFRQAVQLSSMCRTLLAHTPHTCVWSCVTGCPDAAKLCWTLKTALAVDMCACVTLQAAAADP